MIAADAADRGLVAGLGQPAWLHAQTSMTTATYTKLTRVAT